MIRLPYVREALTQVFSKPSTEKYPFVKKEAPAGYRGRIKFHPERCINCGMCIRVCSPGAIVRTVEKQEEGDLVTMEFHMDSCTFCQMCSDFCAKNSIEMTADYEMVATDPKDLIETGTFLKKKPQPKKQAAEKPAPKAEEKEEKEEDKE